MTAGRSTTPRRGPTGTSGAVETSPRRLWAWLGGVLRRLNEQLTSLNARMEGESSCRRTSSKEARPLANFSDFAQHMDWAGLIDLLLSVAAILTTRRLSGCSGSLSPDMRSLPGVIQMSSYAT